MIVSLAPSPSAQARYGMAGSESKSRPFVNALHSAASSRRAAPVRFKVRHRPRTEQCPEQRPSQRAAEPGAQNPNHSVSGVGHSGVPIENIAGFGAHNPQNPKSLRRGVGHHVATVCGRVIRAGPRRENGETEPRNFSRVYSRDLVLRIDLELLLIIHVPQYQCGPTRR